MSQTAEKIIPHDDVAGTVRRILAARSIHRRIEHDEDLRDAGVTSLDMVNLVLSLEAELNVLIPEADITPANFRSIATIEAMIVNLRG